MTREQAIEWLADVGLSPEHIMEIMELLDTLEHKTGHWIITNDCITTANLSMYYLRCSCCGGDSLEEGNYCPKCGAKMVSEK